MQLIPRYLVSNRSTIVVNETGFVTEYRPVYSRHLQVYKGIDNKLEFRVLNADQKPIDLSTLTPKFVAFDENQTMIIEHDGVAIVGNDSSLTRGLFQVTITENDLLNVKQQYLSYNIYLVDSDNTKTLTYSHSNFDNDATIFVNGSTFPGPKASYNVDTFTKVDSVTDEWTSEAVTAQPAINGNEALHTAAVYTASYSGDVVVQATLDNQVTESTQWADITTLTFTGSETEPKPVNFNGVFSHIRFVANANPADKITKILVRN
jgi:hypothetical protein